MSCHHNDPCNNPLLPTTNVGYSGPNLPCTGITTNEVLTISLQKIDEKICTLIAAYNSLQEQINELTTTSTTTTVAPTTTSTTSSSTTSTSTSTSSTTSTTTTVPPTTSTTSTSSTSSTSTTSTSSTSTTSTTSTSSTSTTSTTSTSSTTTTTTTIYECELAGNAVEIVTTTTTTTTEVPVLCDEYFNNTGDTLTGINYTSCEGATFTNVNIVNNQGFCAQQGTVFGGESGFLTNTGSCSL